MTTSGLWKSTRPEGSLRYWREPGFDGNLTDHIQNWFIPRQGAYEGVDGDVMETLRQLVEQGHLAWVLFPTLLLTEEDQVILLL